MKKKIVFIGNSIVAGYPWGKGKSFTGVLRRTLKGEPDTGLMQPDYAKSTGFDIINKGVNGDTTAGIAGRFDHDVLAHDPDMVFFHTGANDFIYREAGPREAFDNLEALAAKADSAGVLTVYMTPVPVDAGKAEFMWLAGCGISYDAVNRDLELLSGFMRESGRPFVDTNALYRDFIADTGDPDLAYLDGVHPTPAGHVYIAAQILNLLEEQKLYI